MKCENLKSVGPGNRFLMLPLKCTQIQQKFIWGIVITKMRHWSKSQARKLILSMRAAEPTDCFSNHKVSIFIRQLPVSSYVEAVCMYLENWRMASWAQ